MEKYTNKVRKYIIGTFCLVVIISMAVTALYLNCFAALLATLSTLMIVYLDRR